MSDNHTDHYEDKYIYNREDPPYSDGGFSGELTLRNLAIAFVAGAIGVFLIFGPFT